MSTTQLADIEVVWLTALTRSIWMSTGAFNMVYIISVLPTHTHIYIYIYIVLIPTLSLCMAVNWQIVLLPWENLNINVYEILLHQIQNYMIYSYCWYKCSYIDIYFLNFYRDYNFIVYRRITYCKREIHSRW